MKHSCDDNNTKQSKQMKNHCWLDDAGVVDSPLCSANTKATSNNTATFSLLQVSLEPATRQLKRTKRPSYYNNPLLVSRHQEDCSFRRTENGLLSSSSCNKRKRHVLFKDDMNSTILPSSSSPSSSLLSTGSSKKKSPISTTIHDQKRRKYQRRGSKCPSMFFSPIIRNKNDTITTASTSNTSYSCIQKKECIEDDMRLIEEMYRKYVL